MLNSNPAPGISYSLIQQVPPETLPYVIAVDFRDLGFDSTRITERRASKAIIKGTLKSRLTFCNGSADPNKSLISLTRLGMSKPYQKRVKGVAGNFRKRV